ncbi:MAG: endonuclease domain-containing protein [Acutalibacteraceae bacterium]
MSLPYNKQLIYRAKTLRKNMTPQERHLWYDYLRSYKIRFQRQKVIDSYIADFYCHKAKLIIELDGSQHYTKEGMEYDKVRTDILKAYNLEVIRFSNYDVDNCFEGVCMEIDKKVNERLLQFPNEQLK